MGTVFRTFEGVLPFTECSDDGGGACPLAGACRLKCVLADAIEDLPEKMRLVVTMYYFENMRMKEIGEVLNLSESRVSRLIAAAELQLKSIVKRRSGE